MLIIAARIGVPRAVGRFPPPRTRSAGALSLARSLALLAAVVACTAPAARAQDDDDELPPAVAAALRRAQIPSSAVAVVVVRAADAPGPSSRTVRGARGFANDGATLLSLHAGRAMNPASTMKLVTTYAALESLGPAFTWKTVLATNGAQSGASLDGDLFVRGAGDPKLVYEQLWLMLRQLKGRGIRTVRGDVVLDRTLFEPVAYDPAAFDGEPSRPYNVGPDALLVNYKAITLRFVPDDARREVRVAFDPPLADFAIGPIAWQDGPCGDWRQKAAPDFGRPDQIAFAGGFPGACGEQTWNVSVLDHRQFDAGVIRALWNELGGAIGGTVRDGQMPFDARILVEHESPSLAEVIRDINKYSNNVMARELFLSFAAEANGATATTERAQRALRGFYAAKGIPLPDLVVDNGSGLSRRERIAAQSMAAVLEAAWASPVMPEFVSSLPLVGYDGTMRRRLTTQTVSGQAHVKTGSLADARAIAGYVLAASGKTWVVVCIVNHPNAGGAQAAQDALLQWTYEHG